MKKGITFIITGLGVGGAEMMLFKLLSKLNRDRFSPKVISLVDYSPMADKFRDIGVPVTVIGMGKELSAIKGFGNLLRILHTDKPQIVQTWMYHADLIGGIGARLVGTKSVVWNIRHSNLNSKVDKRSTILTAKTCARLSFILPSHIVCCSEAAKTIHAQLGYDSSKIVVIPNGFDLIRFHPDKGARHSLREQLGASDNKIIIGLIGRYHQQKDHSNFIQAAKLLIDKLKDVEFLLCGRDVDWQNSSLVRMINDAGIRDSFHLLGFRDDIPAVTASIDIATSSSSCGEGFSNTIGEAMACGVPCVVTDVGDSAMIVGATGKVVPPRNPEELSQAWMSLIHGGEIKRQNLGVQARERILENFSIDNIVNKYQDLYLRALH